MIASILTLQIFATPNYQSFENKTGSIVEEINITYVLKMLLILLRWLEIKMVL